MKIYPRLTWIFQEHKDTLYVNEPYITISPPITVHHGWSRRIGPRDMNEALAE
jgi:hypothetical protein